MGSPRLLGGRAITKKEELNKGVFMSKGNGFGYKGYSSVFSGGSSHANANHQTSKNGVVHHKTKHVMVSIDGRPPTIQTEKEAENLRERFGDRIQIY